ncbi:hypothetical protein FHS77_000353 [Paenochrobactrum gallinarii]|uniref:AEC family transporter n=1 Tax=Paenochrobactrum gallinarii TaxID=643673 RepID=A0A841LP90_9HYPH|nr:AEC family transporter [Paenochrobactrum gallinarii]MBB6259845.1 hypothetical protein [Paenochrobactrum gallinarii]
MLSTLLVVLPIFALIFAGWAAAKTRILGGQASTELNRFVVYLALPALLFDITATTNLHEIWQPAFIGAFCLASFIIFGLAFLSPSNKGQDLTTKAIDGLNASYPNTAYMGFPLSMLAFGSASMPLVAMATIITVCVIFAVAITLIELSRQKASHKAKLIFKTIISLARNPLLFSPALGIAYSLSGLPLPESAHTFLKLLGGAASPCALVALGLFLAASKPLTRSNISSISYLVSLKLVAQPVLTYIAAVYIFQLPPLLTHTAVLITALPTGTGSFMLAEYYRTDATITSNTILVSTMISVLTVSAYLSLIA